MVSKAVFSLGLLVVLFVYTTNSSPISTTETNYIDLDKPCIVNQTIANCTRCVPGSFAPYPNNTRMFYMCNNGELYPKHCPNDTVWNQDNLTCIREVPCIENVHEINCTPCKPGTLLQSPDDPSAYYNCSSNGILCQQFCDQNTVWDQESEACIIDDYINVDKPCIFNQTIANCTKCKPGSYAPYPNNTRMYYVRNNGALQPMHCSNDTVWNQNNHTCIHEDIPATTEHYDTDSPTSMIPSTADGTTDVPSTETTSNTTDITSSTSEITTETANPSSTSVPPSTTPTPHSFDGASFGGGIAAGLGLALLVLLLIRCCCSSPTRDGYTQHT